MTGAKGFVARPHRKGRRAVLCVLAAALLLGWTASLRVDTGPAAGTRFEDPFRGLAAPPVPDEPRIRLATFNIHGGRGRDGRFDLPRVAECLAGTDLVGLNELHGAYFWERQNQAELLGGFLEASWLFAPTERRWWHYEFGNGVLARVPIAFWQRVPLPRRHGRSFRNLVLVGVPIGDRTLHVVVTHLDRSSDLERKNQLRAAGDFFLALQEPAVLMGDLNTTADEPELAALLAAPGVRDPLADRLADPPRRIDWILARGLRTLDAGIVDTGASDHPLVWAELALPAPSQP